jgi:hypothetical protein
MQHVPEVQPEAIVTLREITTETVATICGLADTLTEPKKNYVASNERSLAQARANEKAWDRGLGLDARPWRGRPGGRHRLQQNK